MSTSEDNILDRLARFDAPALERLIEQAEALLAQKDDRPPRRHHPGSGPCQAALFKVPRDIRYLDTEQIDRLGAAFDTWRDAARTAPIRRARERMRLVYLMLRHSGGKLGEVLAINENTDIDMGPSTVTLGGGKPVRSRPAGDRAQPFLEEVCAGSRQVRPIGTCAGSFSSSTGLRAPQVSHEQAVKADLPPGRVSPTSLRAFPCRGTAARRRAPARGPGHDRPFEPGAHLLLLLLFRSWIASASSTTASPRRAHENQRPQHLFRYRQQRAQKAPC